MLSKRVIHKGVKANDRYNGTVSSSDNWKTFKIEINAGIFLLATTALGKLVQEYIINKINNDILF